MEVDACNKWSMNSFEKTPCSFEVTGVRIKANELFNDAIIDE